MLGGHSTARGAVLGAILGAAGLDIPFVDELCAQEAKKQEVEALVDAL
jgi:ADP-ribosylglycohydrolase